MNFNEYVKIREERFGAVIFETLREKVFVTNTTGRDILNLLKDGLSEDEIIDNLSYFYSATLTEIREDVTGFINQLKDSRILT